MAQNDQQQSSKSTKTDQKATPKTETAKVNPVMNYLQHHAWVWVTAVICGLFLIGVISAAATGNLRSSTDATTSQTTKPRHDVTKVNQYNQFATLHDVRLKVNQITTMAQFGVHQAAAHQKYVVLNVTLDNQQDHDIQLQAHDFVIQGEHQHLYAKSWTDVPQGLTSMTLKGHQQTVQNVVFEVPMHWQAQHFIYHPQFAPHHVFKINM